MKSPKNVRVISANSLQQEAYEKVFSVAHDKNSTEVKAILTEEQINSVPDQIFNINLSNDDKRHLLLDCFVPYTDEHIAECNNPSILTSFFLVENDQIVYQQNTADDTADKHILTEDNCKYLK